MEHAIACFVHRPNSNQGIMVMSSSIFIRISTRIIVDFGRILLINKMNMTSSLHFLVNNCLLCINFLHMYVCVRASVQPSSIFSHFDRHTLRQFVHYFSTKSFNWFSICIYIRIHSFPSIQVVLLNWSSYEHVSCVYIYGYVNVTLRVLTCRHYSLAKCI